MTFKETAKQIRSRIKIAGIKASVRMITPTGCQVIQVSVPAYDIEFNADEQRRIRLIAKVNGLTWVQGMEIDIDQNTNPSDFNFYVY